MRVFEVAPDGTAKLKRRTRKQKPKTKPRPMPETVKVKRVEVNPLNS